ncbi:MAG: GldG family protein [Deltaproteobacteria bacterium]|nr:GldG family protein [Deltaproteobacteria bacterium]
MATPDRPPLTTKTAGKSAALAGVACGFAAWFLRAYYPHQRLAAGLLAAGGAAALAYFFVTERRSLGRSLFSRSARYGVNAAVVTVAFLGVLVLVNVLASRHNVKWDLTAGRVHTLSKQTVKVLRKLSTPVTVTAFYQDATEPRAQMRRLLDAYREQSHQLRVVFADPDKSPELARRLGVREYGTAVFASGTQTFRINQATEEAVTNALVRVTRRSRKTVYFLSGHGEHDIEDTQRNGYSAAAKALENQGFAPKPLLLLREGEVPRDCDVLVVPGPAKALPHKEEEAVDRYLERGGKVLLLVDPLTPPAPDEILAKWGVALRDDVIIDPMSRLFGGSFTTPILTEYPPHDVTKDFRVATFLPLARSLEAANPLPRGVTYSPVARTSPQAWGETNLKDDRASFDEAQDVKGPLTAAALFERGDASAGGDAKAAAQLFVVGDSDFAANTYYSFAGNGDFFLNIVSYLAREQDLISIRPKDARPTPLSLSRAQAATLFYATVVLAPLAAIASGLAIWWRRRNL